MIFKITGSIILFLASCSLGFYFSKRDSYRINELLTMKKALTILLSEIEFSNALPEAAANIAEHTVGSVSRMFSFLGERIREKKGEDIWILWQESLSRYKRESYFTDEDISSLYSLGRTLGYLNREMQINSIRLILNYIDGEVEILNEKREQNKKMYQSLGILGGLFLIIVFI